MTYALVDPSDAIVREMADHRVDPSVPCKAGWRWLPVVVVQNDTRTPGNNFTTSDPEVTTVHPDRVEKVRSFRDMTAPEMDAQKTLIVDGEIDMLQFRHLFNMENRVRALESKPAITVQQYKTALKGML